MVYHGLGGGFKYFFMFTPNLGEMIQLDEHIVQMSWFNHHLVVHSMVHLKNIMGI